MLMPEPSDLFSSLVFGTVGLGYYIYGKKQNFYFMICGIGLMVYTFVVSGSAALYTGIILTIAPFILSKFLD